MMSWNARGWRVPRIKLFHCFILILFSLPSPAHLMLRNENSLRHYCSPQIRVYVAISTANNRLDVTTLCKCNFVKNVIVKKGINLINVIFIVLFDCTRNLLIQTSQLRLSSLLLMAAKPRTHLQEGNDSLFTQSAGMQIATLFC